MKKLFNFAKEKDIDGPFRTEYLVSLAFNYRVMEVAASVTHFLRLLIKGLILNYFRYFPCPILLREKVIYHLYAIRYRAGAGSMFLAPAPRVFVS